MDIKLVYVVFLVFVLNCVINVAKSSEEKAENNSNIRVQGISTESGTVLLNTGRIKARKGAPVDGNATKPIEEDTVPKELPISNVTANSSHSNSTYFSESTSIQNVTILSATSAIVNTTTSPISTTLTTRKPRKKPTITFSADDNPEILESEKNINYTVATKIDDVIDPKTSSLSDRTIVGEESRTRRNYILYMGLAFALPLTLTLIHITYKKVRNWMEIRHYQRVVS